ncbi:SGNH/GDSL hydrolase family protein [Nocardioides zeae]|uniref:SGNH/GDSL hydrolase family protein n=1 Tax=Nocardioides zeae TaxID=1457234 RepID=UPI00286B9A86|nr:SGNH/GDSL hydrolase family protein [Nocardioides zeae]
MVGAKVAELLPDLLDETVVTEDQIADVVREPNLPGAVGQEVLRGNAPLVGQALRALRTSGALRVCVRGDSTVYGHDTVSADRVAPPVDVLPDGSTHTATRSPSPWPAVLQDRLVEVYGGAVTVVNQGYSGDWVGRGFDRWLNNPNADVTLYGYGINDASSLGVPAEIRGDVRAYVAALEQMVRRDLAWGSAVAFLAPMRQRGQTGTSAGVVIDAYRSALHIVAPKYGIPVIDAEQFLTNAKRDAWSDDFHLTTKGNQIVGARIAALFLPGALLDPKRREVVGGAKLVPRLHDGFHFPATAVGGQSGGYFTPNDNVDGQGIAARLAGGTTGTATIAHVSFYAAEPDLVIFPYYYLAGVAGETGVNLTLELDFGVEQGDNYHDHVIVPVSAAGALTAPPASAAGVPIVGVGTFYNRDALRQSHALRVSTPGWHTLTIKGTRSAAASTVDLLALEFFSWRDWQDTQLGRGAAHGLSSPTIDESSDITQTAISWPELLRVVGAKSWTSHQYAAPMLKLTVRTYGVGVAEYALLCTQRPDNAGADIAARVVDSAGAGEGPASAFAHKIGEFNYTGGAALPSTDAAGRELLSIAYRAADQMLLLNWRTTNSSDGSTAKNLKRAFEYHLRLL